MELERRQNEPCGSGWASGGAAASARFAAFVPRAGSWVGALQLSLTFVTLADFAWGQPAVLATGYLPNSAQGRHRRENSAAMAGLGQKLRFNLGTAPLPCPVTAGLLFGQTAGGQWRGSFVSRQRKVELVGPGSPLCALADVSL